MCGRGIPIAQRPWRAPPSYAQCTWFCWVGCAKPIRAHAETSDGITKGLGRRTLSWQDGSQELLAPQLCHHMGKSLPKNEAERKRKQEGKICVNFLRSSWTTQIKTPLELILFWLGQLELHLSLQLL